MSGSQGAVRAPYLHLHCRAVASGELLGGAALLALSAGSALTFGILVGTRRFAGLGGVPAVLAAGTFSFVGFVAIHLVPGALGILGRPTVAVMALLLLAVSLCIPRPAHATPGPAFPPGPGSDAWSWGFATAALGLVSTYAIAHAFAKGGVPTGGVDMTTFHLPNVARWIQTGSLWEISDFVPHRAFGTYPNTSDVVLLGVVLPFDSPFLVRLVNYPALALTGLATYAIARELTAPAAPAALFAAGLVAMPVVASIAFEGLADTLMLAGFGTGVLFLLRHRRTDARGDLVVAGVALGLSFGTKWYAPPAVALVLVAWGVAGLLERRTLRQVLAPAGLVVGLVTLVGGFWLLRNLVGTGNPVFPVEVALGPLTLFDAPRDIHRELFGFTLADYLGSPGIYRRIIWPSFLAFMGWYAVMLWALLPVAAVVALRTSRAASARSQPVLLLCGAAVLIGLVYLVIPYTALGHPDSPVLAVANSRYVVPALLMVAATVAWACGRIGRLRALVELVALVAVYDALTKNDHLSAGNLAAAALIVAAAAAAVLIVRRRPLRLRRPRIPALAGAVTLLAALGVGALFLQERRYDENRLAETEATGRWVDANAPSGRRVGVVGEGFVVLPMFGPRLDNQVEYVGPTIDGMLRTYGTKADLSAALRRGRYDLVLLQDSGLVEPEIPKRHERWIRELGYRMVAEGSLDNSFGQPVRLYRAPKTPP